MSLKKMVWCITHKSNFFCVPKCRLIIFMNQLIKTVFPLQQCFWIKKTNNSITGLTNTVVSILNKSMFLIGLTKYSNDSLTAKITCRRHRLCFKQIVKGVQNFWTDGLKTRRTHRVCIVNANLSEYELLYLKNR